MAGARVSASSKTGLVAEVRCAACSSRVASLFRAPAGQVRVQQHVRDRWSVRERETAAAVGLSDMLERLLPDGPMTPEDLWSLSGLVRCPGCKRDVPVEGPVLRRAYLLHTRDRSRRPEQVRSGSPKSDTPDAETDG